MKYIKNLILLKLIFVGSLQITVAQKSIEYGKPVESIQEILSYPTNSQMKLSPDAKYIALGNYDRFNKTTQNGEKINLAGVSFNTLTNMEGSVSYYTGIKFKLASQDSTEYFFSGLHEKLQIVDYKWSPNSKYIAAAIKVENNITLWLLDVERKSSKMLYSDGLSFSLIKEDLFKWLPNENALIFTAIFERNSELLNAPEQNPKVFENRKGSEPHRTYQGLLESEYDENLFDYYGTSQLKKVDILTGEITSLGIKGCILDFQPSPDGRYIMMHYVKKPYSYEYTVHRFPSAVVLISNSGKVVETINIPKVVRPLGRDAAYNVDRNFKWRSDKDAMLIWVRPLDAGDPKSTVTERDALYSWNAPFTGSPDLVCTTGLRYEDTYWINDSLAIVEEEWYQTRTINWLLINPETSHFLDTIAHFNSQSLLESPGNPMKKKKDGLTSLFFSDSSILLSRVYLNDRKEVVPFLEKRNLFSGVTESLWESLAPNYEYPVLLENNETLQSLIITRQSQNTPVNVVRYNLADSTDETLTYNINNLEIFNSELVQKELSYFRQDSVKLNATMLYNLDSLKNGGLKGGIVFAYPIDFIGSENASEDKYYPYNFRAYLSLQKLLALYGYVVLDNTSFPVIGNEESLPNDTYLEQLGMNAKAVISALKIENIIDTEKVSIMGHSYGAFMVANMVTHSSLFKTGIAISGAYNRSLTPFGFQREYRTYWEEQDLYHKISPFQNADKMNNSILLFHGEEDVNPGTHYEQSERYFNALKGLGKSVRFVSLPGEEHHFRNLNTYMHMLWEIDRWLIEHFNSNGNEVLTRNYSSNK